MSMRVFKRYNHNANHRLRYKYHKSTHPQVTLDKYCQEGKHDPKEGIKASMKVLNEKKEQIAGVVYEDSEPESKESGTIEEKPVKFNGKLIESDLKSIGIDWILKLWIAQLLENCLDQNPDQIEVRFYRKGYNGFDVICNGDGIPDSELPYICRCMEFRERNEIYKSKSIGYRGEALNSLAKSSSLTVITKHYSSEFAWKVQYGINGDIANIEQYDGMKEDGTIVKVRDLHKNNEEHRKKFFASLQTAYESTISLLNSHSYISYDRRLIVSQALKAEDADRGNVKEIWSTVKTGDLMQNVKSILKSQFRNTFPNMAESVVEWSNTFYPDMVSMKCIQLRPGTYKNTLLIKKCLHIYLNGRPAQATKRFHACFYDLYRDFKIPPQTVPFVVLDITAKEETFDIKIQGDMRKFYFKPQYEKRMYELIRTFMWSLFNKLAMDKNFDPDIKPGMQKTQVFKQKRDGHGIDKRTYKVQKPDIEHIENDNMDTADLTSDSSDDELVKEQMFNDIQKNEKNEKIDPFQKVENDKFDFSKHKVNKEDKKQRQFDSKIGDLLSNFKKMREERFGKKEEAETPLLDLNINQNYDESQMPTDERMTAPTSVRFSSNENSTESHKCNHQEENKYSQDEVMDMADQPQNMLSGDEQMYDPPEEEDRPNLNYHQFDLNLIRDTYLGVKTKADPAGCKSEVKRETKHGEYYKTKSFFERLGPQYEEMPIQTRGFFDKYMTGVHNDKLKKVFLKREFYSLQIIGQFNLGFVCATLNNGRDLFILDQHASHERHNLETFNKELKIASQLIIQPIKLKIDQQLAKLLPKYAYIFEFNGLKFKLPEDFEEQLEKSEIIEIKLISLPQSCDLQFDESDFLDLLTALRNYDQDCEKAGEQLLDQADLIAQLRPRKIHGILALKACKGAIFIGEVMTKRAMRELIDHLRPLRRPWICAHGRPTMRYLLNFENFRTEFALPSKVQVDKTKYCSLSRKFRQKPPQIIKNINKKEENQLQNVIYPSQELIQLKREFLVRKIQTEKNKPKIEEIKETRKFVIEKEPKKELQKNILGIKKDEKCIQKDEIGLKKEEISKSSFNQSSDQKLIKQDIIVPKSDNKKRQISLVDRGSTKSKQKKGKSSKQISGVSIKKGENDSSIQTTDSSVEQISQPLQM